MSDQTQPTKNIFQQIGTPGLEAFSGYIGEAYIPELRWPTVYPIYNKYRRADPETVIAREVFATMARGIRLQFSPRDDATDDEKKFAEFGDSALDDIAGGQGEFLETMIENVPFFGWGYWEALPGIRSRDWRSPDGDDWESEADDGLIGFRRFAFRSPSSFFSWEMDDRGKRISGLVQMDVPNPPVMIPLDRSIHLTFGDTNNPEGLSPLEAIYRLERYKYALELIQGIGYEHAAGYLEVRSTSKLTDDDKAHIRKTARAILSAQEANYAAWPEHLTGEIKDITFQAGANLLEAIRHYHMLKLQLFMMQWASIATTAGSGAYSAMSDSSSMFVMYFNSMMRGFADQLDSQIGKRLLRLNRDKFPGIERRPRIVPTSVEKTISLTELGQLISAMGIENLGDEDWLAIRKASKILPEVLPEKKPEEAQPTDPQEDQQIEDEANDQSQGGESQDDQIEERSRMAQKDYLWKRYILAHPEASNE
jgi:hypothetical protein